MLRTLESARAVLEASRGAGGTPTRLIYFDDATHNQEIATITPAEMRAGYEENYRHYPGIERNGFQFGGDFTFDDAIWWLNLHVKAVAAGVGAGADKTWTFLPSQTDDLKSALIQYAATDSIAISGWQVPGCLGDTLDLTWVKGETLKYKSTLRTPNAATQITAFTGALSDRATISALGTATQIFVDTATIGTTPDPQIVEVGFTLNNGLVPFDPLNNTALAASLQRPNARNWQLKVTRNFGNKTELDAYIAKTIRKVRVRTLGPVVGGSNYKIDLDCYGVWDLHSWSEVDGIIMAELTMRSVYDTTSTSSFSFVVVNATAAIT